MAQKEQHKMDDTVKSAPSGLKTWDDAARLTAEGKVKERMAKFKRALKESGDAALRQKIDRRPMASPSRRASAYQQMLEKERSKLKEKRTRDDHMQYFEGVDVGSIKEKFKGKSLVETEQAFLQQLQASQRQHANCSSSVSPGTAFDMSKLKEMFAGGSVAETAEMFQARQAQLKLQYQQAQVHNVSSMRIVHAHSLPCVPFTVRRNVCT
jgi:hypothetical protein